MTGKAGFSLDLGKCVGCGACVLACRIENQIPLYGSWRRVLQVNAPRLSGGPTYHLSVACHHCENPPCAGACPTGAIQKGSDGIVVLNSELCLGCRYCEMACPFGAPAYDHKTGVMTKCNLCHHKLSDGAPPACVEACPTKALGYITSDGQPEEVYRPASGLPGFGDPAQARPGFWVKEPGGDLRSEWYQRLKELMGPGQGAEK